MHPILELTHVTKRFPADKGEITVLNDVSLTVQPGETVCLVGESGCGKTTTGKLVAGLHAPSEGHIRYRGKDIWQMSKDEFAQYRREVQFIHQDPYASLNPAHTIGRMLSFPLKHHGITKDEKSTQARVRELLKLVDLTPVDDFVHKFPHQLSGGQRQRASIARSLTLNPKVIVADESVSMVDVSIRLSLLGILSRLKQEMGMTVLFITHDLAIANYFARNGRTVVMYLGRVVELARTPDIMLHPKHPYAQALLGAVPEADPQLTRNKVRVPLRSLDVPSLRNLPSGCAFHPRCPVYAQGVCETDVPQLTPMPDGRVIACHVAVKNIMSE